MEEMKWNRFIFHTLLFLPVLLFGLSGCGVTRKVVTETRTTYKVDTIYRIRLDFKVTGVSLPLDNFLKGDTLRAENRTSVAVSYYNPTARKVELKLTGKVFDVPVKADIVKKEKTKEIKKEFKFNWLLFLFGITTGIIMFFTFKRVKKLWQE